MAPYTWLWFPNSRSLSRSARGSGLTTASSYCLSPPLPERQKAKAGYKGGHKKDRRLLFLPGFSPMCDEVILLPTCWNWREDELVGHNARAGRLSPTPWPPREREAFCCLYFFQLKKSMSSRESRAVASIHLVCTCLSVYDSKSLLAWARPHRTSPVNHVVRMPAFASTAARYY